MIEEADEGVLLHVHCANCTSSVIAVVTHGRLGSSAVGILTDLSAEELEHQRAHGPLTARDILHLHTQLQSPDLNFSSHV